jgi:hypothetical protein
VSERNKVDSTMEWMIVRQVKRWIAWLLYISMHIGGVLSQPLIDAFLCD